MHEREQPIESGSHFCGCTNDLCIHKLHYNDSSIESLEVTNLLTCLVSQPTSRIQKLVHAFVP
jgi:hypothetical protein